MLMVRDRKDYREIESHLRNNPSLVREPGLEKAPSKSSIHSAASRIGLDTLADVNDAIVAQFKKNLGRPRKKNVTIDASGLGIRRRSSWYSIRTHSSPSKKRDFRKLHLASECHAKDKPIYSWTLTAGNRHDSPRFRTLLKRVHGEIGHVCADKADSCRPTRTLRRGSKKPVVTKPEARPPSSCSKRTGQPAGIANRC
jgi:hypothetical protein